MIFFLVHFPATFSVPTHYAQQVVHTYIVTSVKNIFVEINNGIIRFSHYVHYNIVTVDLKFVMLLLYFYMFCGCRYIRCLPTYYAEKTHERIVLFELGKIIFFNQRFLYCVYQIINKGFTSVKVQVKAPSSPPTQIAPMVRLLPRPSVIPTDGF